MVCVGEAILRLFEAMNRVQRMTVFITGGVLLLVIAYLFQKEFLDWMMKAGFLSDPGTVFVVNRMLRMLLNDMGCILIIYGIFEKKIYLRLAAWLMLFEMVVLLPVYLVVKLSLEGPTELSSPLLSQIHRLIVNPLLMFVLMAGLFYQRCVFRKTP